MFCDHELKRGIQLFRFEGRLCSEVKGVPGVYVTMDGEVYVLPWNGEDGRWVTFHENRLKNPNRYFLITVRGHHYSVHRLVAEAFIYNPDPENKRFVDHINRDRLDNRVENLRWVSAEENARNTAQTERVWERGGKHSWLRQK